MKSIIFNKYQVRSCDYHWEQISHNLFKFNAYVIARYQQVIRLIPSGNQRILDIGCGDGVLLSLIGHGRLYGVDLDQSSLDYAATKVKAKFLKVPAELLPFKSGFFDVVIATEIIEHLDQPEKLLAEAKRVLKRSGRLILTTPVKTTAGLTDRLHVREFTSAELLQLCRGYFKRVKISFSHPLWLKTIYTVSLVSLGRYHFDIGRWLINAIVLLTGWNPFLYFSGHPSQQLVEAQK